VKDSVLHVTAVILTLFLSAGLLIVPSMVWGNLICIILMLGFVVYKSKRENLFIFLLIIALPLSVEVALTDDHKIFLPSELLLGAMIIALFPACFLPKMRHFITGSPLPLLWVASFFIPVIFSGMPLVSFKFFVINTAYVILFFYFITFFFERGIQIDRMIIAYMMVFIPVTFYGIYQLHQFGYNPVTLPGVFKPFYNDHTIFGASAAMLTGFFAGMSGKNKRWLIPLVLALSAVYLSGSRAAIISMLILLPLVLFARFSFIRKLSPLLFLVLLVWAFSQRDNVRDYIRHSRQASRDVSANMVDRAKSVTNIKSDASNIERLNRWTAAIQMFAEKPHTGFGPGTYRFTYIPYQDKTLENRLTVKNPDNPPPGSGGTAHSELFLQLSENGWPTTLIFIVLLFRWTYLGIRYGRFSNPLFLGAFLGLTTYFIHMQFNNFLSTDSFAFLFWTMGSWMEWSVKNIENE
jgi:putative inorganic carbon (hco3(-)) transporter